MTDIDLQQAAHAARQLVNSKFQLQGLLAVLDELAGNQNQLQEVRQSIAKARGELAECNQATAAAREKHSEEVASMENSLRMKKDLQAAQIELLTNDTRRAEERLANLNKHIADAEGRLARVREALTGAAANVGVAQG